MRVYLGKRLVCQADVVRNVFSKAWGWMLHLPKKDEGLLFPYGYEWKIGIWMPFMLTDINIAWLDEEFKVVDFQHAVPMTLDPRTWRVHYPKKPARYVLELHLGKRLNIGDRVTIKP